MYRTVLFRFVLLYQVYKLYTRFTPVITSEFSDTHHYLSDRGKKSDAGSKILGVFSNLIIIVCSLLHKPAFFLQYRMEKKC